MNTCEVSKYCGGCQYQGMPYAEQLQIKQDHEEKLLGPFCQVDRIIGAQKPENYRNKVQISFARDENHRIISGYYLPSTHTIVPITSCMICDENINRIMRSIQKIVTRLHISIYDERAMKGCLRHVLIRSANSGEYMVVLVTGSVKLDKKDELIKAIISYNPQVKTIIHNINRRRTSVVLGDQNKVLYGKGYITDELCGLKFRISASSFYQVNRFQSEVLYREAINMAQLKKDQILLDAYCGTGTIALSCAGNVQKVIGVEINKQAISDANTNMQINDIKNAGFICEDAGRYMEYLSKKHQHIDTVIMDPPRAGSDIRFMSSMVKLSPDRIVYISCNPQTLKDDLKYLQKYYMVKKIQPVDMFPFTAHVETIVLLEKK